MNPTPDPDPREFDMLLKAMPEAPADAGFAQRLRHLAALTPQEPLLRPRSWWAWLDIADSGVLVAGTTAGLVLALMLSANHSDWWAQALAGRHEVASYQNETGGVSLAQLIAPPPYWTVVRVDRAAAATGSDEQ